MTLIERLMAGGDDGAPLLNDARAALRMTRKEFAYELGYRPDAVRTMFRRNRVSKTVMLAAAALLYRKGGSG